MLRIYIKYNALTYQQRERYHTYYGIIGDYWQRVPLGDLFVAINVLYDYLTLDNSINERDILFLVEFHKIETELTRRGII